MSSVAESLKVEQGKGDSSYLRSPQALGKHSVFIGDSNEINTSECVGE